MQIKLVQINLKCWVIIGYTVQSIGSYWSLRPKEA